VAAGFAARVLNSRCVERPLIRGGSASRLARSLAGRRWAALVAIVAVSTALRAWASWGVPTPWIAPDELIYGLTAQSLYRTGHLAILGGPTPYYSAVVPALDGLPLSLGDMVLGYGALKIIQALLMSLAAVPVYLWGRRLMAPGWALAAALLTVSIPGLAYSGLLMSEVAFYPVVVLAAWATAAAVESPTWYRQLLCVGAVAAAVGTRLQAAVLLVVLPTAIVVDAAFRRQRLRLRPFAPVLGAMALLAAIWAASRIGAHQSVLGAYGGASGTATAGRSARFVAYHVGDVALLTGLLPFCAFLALLWRAGRRGEEDRAFSAYLAVTFAVTAWLVVEVGVFASREVGRLAERNLIAVAPLLFLAFGAWLDRDARGRDRVRVGAAVIAAAAVLALPFGTLVVPAAVPDAFTLIPLDHLRRLTSLGLTEAVVAAGVVVLALLFAAAPRRVLVALPALLVLLLGAGSVVASREVLHQARSLERQLLGPSRRWVDGAADGRVAYVYDGQGYWNVPWETIFWNRRIDRVYDLPGTEVLGPLPQRQVDVSPDGRLTPEGDAPPAPRYAIVPVNFTLFGERVASARQVGTDRQGLGLWELDLPLRLSTITSGLLPNGDVDRVGALRVFGCNVGAFVATLTAKEPQIVRVMLDGNVVRKRRFSAPASWHVRVPIRPTAAGSGRVCQLEVLAGGFLRSTRFVFDR
jgi:hypothetical protein